MPQVVALVVVYWVEILAVAAVIASGYAAIQARNMKMGGDSQFAQQQMVRSSNEPRRGIYGRAMVSGPLMFIGETGTDREWLYLVIAVCGHVTDGCELVKLDDEVVWKENGGLVSRYRNHVKIKYFNGTQTTADSELVSKFNSWTNNHIGNGISYLRIGIKSDQDVFPSGIPNIKMLIRGKRVFDPRDVTQSRDNPVSWKYTDNWALCCLDYAMLESGVGATEEEIDLDSFIAAANLSDEFVEYQATKFEKRYTINGTWMADQTPQTIIESLLSAGSGKLVFTHGVYSLFAGAYYGPATLTLDDDGLRDDMSLTPFTERADLCNAVRGTFVDPNNFWQSVDFPPVENTFYREKDKGEYIDHDIDLEMVISPWTAQRLAKLHLEQSRAGFTVNYPAKLGVGLQCWPGRVVRLHIPRLGINKEFEVVDWSLKPDQGVDLVLKETAPEIFDWALGEATSRDITPNSDLPDPKQVPTPSGLAFAAAADNSSFLGSCSWNAPGGNSAYRYRLAVFDGLQALIYQQDIASTQCHLPKIDVGFYTVKVWAINTFGYLSNVAAEITIGSSSPANVIGIGVEAGPLSLTIKPGTAAEIAQTTVFEVIGGQNNVIEDAVTVGTGKEIVWADRHPNTTYYLWARTSNNQGKSAWFGPVQTKTSNDKSAIVDLIGATFDKYTWFAWADDNQGSGFTTVEVIGDGKAYMGIATDKDSASPSGNWQEYTWTKIKTEIPPVFTPEEETKLDNLMAGKLPFAPDKDMLAAQDALSNPALANNLITALSLLNQGISAPALGGETPSGAQSKADAAKAAATADPALRNDAYYRTIPDFFFENGLLCYSLSFEGSSENLLSLNNDPAFSVVKDGEHGGNILRVSGERWVYGIGLIPIDTRKRYKMRIKVRQFSNGTGSRQVYAGVVTLDKNLNFIYSLPGTHRYCCAIGLNISEADGWHVIEGYITGAGNDSFNQFRVGTAYIRPVVIVNYANGTGIADIDELSFYEVTDKGDLIAIGMETSAEAQAKADAAKNAAIVAAAADASAKANTAKAQAEANAALDALNKQNYAISTAKLYTDSNRDGANLVKNSAFLMNTVGNIYSFGNIPGWNGWTFNIDSYTVDIWNDGIWALKGGATAVLRQISSGTGTTNKDLTLHTEVIPVVSGKNYCFTGYAGVHRCSAALFGVFYDSNSAEISSTPYATINDSEGFIGGSTLGSYKRLQSFGTAPVNAAYMRLFVRKYDTSSGNDSYLFFTRVSACVVSADTTIAPDWTPGLEYTPDVQNYNAIKTIELGNFNANTGLINTLLASSGLFDALKARIGNFGGLTADTIASLAIATNHLQAGAVTADKFTADTAFIQKLISNIGLFNQLQAQIAVFGGLAANSIAAKAITVDKLDVLSRNLVNNFSITGETKGWTGFPLVDHWHNGQLIKAMEVTTSGNIDGYSESFEIDHSKIYEISFSIHHVSGGLVGQRYFGMYADGNSQVQAFDVYGSFVHETGNFYFWNGQILDGETRKMRAYIIGSDVDVSAVPESLNVFYICKLNPSTKRVGLRALNFYNGGVLATDRWLNPSVTVLGGGQISANQIIANSALFDKLKARIGAFGGLTANEIQADTALINKIVGTSGLFNDLVARLAVFGGLTANSIAADAILGRHIKAGEKITSPIIEGGELRLIGTAYMKVQSASAFGPDGLVEWYGPKILVNGVPDWANLRKSNAITYLAANGDAYFGGSLSAGVLKTGVTNTDKNPYAANSYPVSIGPFGSNGKAKTVVVSFALSAYSQSSSNPNNPTQPHLSWQLQRKIGSGNWATVSSGVFNGTTSADFEAEPPAHWMVRETCWGSFTFTDNTNSTSDFNYRVLVISYSRYHTTSNINTHNLSLISTEQ